MTTYQQCSSNNNCRNQHKKTPDTTITVPYCLDRYRLYINSKDLQGCYQNGPVWLKYLHPPSQNFSNDLKEYCSFNKKNVKWFLKLRPVIFLKIHISTSVQVSDIKFNFWLKTVVLPSWKFLKWWPDFQAQGEYISTPYEVDTPTTTSQ